MAANSRQRRASLRQSLANFRQRLPVSASFGGLNSIYLFDLQRAWSFSLPFGWGRSAPAPELHDGRNMHSRFLRKLQVATGLEWNATALNQARVGGDD